MGIGGLVGRMEISRVENSYARGYVFGQTFGSNRNYGEQIGGLIGVSMGIGSTIQNVYSSGKVESLGKRHINPLVGYVCGTLTSMGMSFYDRDVARNSSVTSQNMNNIKNRLITSESTQNMKLRATFEGSAGKWDFGSTWAIGLNPGSASFVPTYPYFLRVTHQ